MPGVGLPCLALLCGLWVHSLLGMGLEPREVESSARGFPAKGGRACELDCTKYTTAQNVRLTGQNWRSRSLKSGSFSIRNGGYILKRSQTLQICRRATFSPARV